MAVDWSRDEGTVAVIGTGAMGRGIAQVAAQGGLKVLLFDAAAGAAEKARAYIAEMLDGAAKKGRLAPAEAEAAVARIRVVGALEDLAPADAVIEAIVEALDAKRDLFRKLEAVLRPDTVIASNTSSIRIASIAAACTGKARIAGMHFFNPVPLMKLVEVIRAPATAPAVVDALTALGKRMGRVPVTVSDSPGFLVNLGNRPFSTEAVRLAMEGVASPAEVDAILRDAVGFRMGPFELMDLTGLDVNFPAAKIMYEGYFHDRRLATWPLHQAMAESGQLGRKTGGGWYTYDAEGKLVPQPTDAPTDAAPAPTLVLAERDEALSKLLLEAGAELLARDDGVSPIVGAPLGEDASTYASRLGLAARRLVCVDLSGNIAKRITAMRAPGADPAAVAAVIARLAQTGAKVTLIKDSPGFVVQRVVAMIGNLGCEMAQIGIASPADIDLAMKLGLNYPRGSLEMVDFLGGARRVHEILGRIQAVTGDDRYRPSLWLRRRALLDLPVHTPD